MELKSNASRFKGRFEELQTELKELNDLKESMSTNLDLLIPGFSLSQVSAEEKIKTAVEAKKAAAGTIAELRQQLTDKEKAFDQAVLANERLKGANEKLIGEAKSIETERLVEKERLEELELLQSADFALEEQLRTAVAEKAESQAAGRTLQAKIREQGEELVVAAGKVEGLTSQVSKKQEEIDALEAKLEMLDDVEIPGTQGIDQMEVANLEVQSQLERAAETGVWGGCGEGHPDVAPSSLRLGRDTTVKAILDKAPTINAIYRSTVPVMWLRWDGNVLGQPAGTMVQLHPSTAPFAEKVLCTVGEIPRAKRDLFTGKTSFSLSPFRHSLADLAPRCRDAVGAGASAHTPRAGRRRRARGGRDPAGPGLGQPQPPAQLARGR